MRTWNWNKYVILFQRVQAKQIRRSVEYLRDITQKLAIFMDLSVNRSPATFNRINKGLTDMVKSVTQADIAFLHSVLKDYYTGYENRQAIIVDNLKILLEQMSGHSSGARDESMISSEIKYPIGLAKFLNVSVNAFLSIDDYLERQIKDAPISLIPNDYNECKDELGSMGTILIHPTQISWNQNNLIQHNTDFINSYPDFYTISNMRDCVSGLELKLNHIFALTVHLTHTMNNYFGQGNGTDFGEHIIGLGNDLDILQNSIDWLSVQLSSYSENRTTKIELADTISNSLLLKIKQSMNRVISVINVNVIEYLLSRTNDLDMDIPMMYMKTLDAMRTLAPYYEVADVENKLRVLQIWRHPVVRLYTGDVLQFMHPASEAWRTWPLSVPMDEFILNGNAAKLVSSMVKEYNKVLRGELLRIRSRFDKVRNDVITSFARVLNDLTNVRMESAMAEDFIL